MSFTETIDQMRAKTKTVTRRTGWKEIEVGQLIQPVVKMRGLKKGEKQELIGGPIRVVTHGWEPLEEITQEEVAREGFPEWTPAEWVAFYCRVNKAKPTDLTHRIEFEYVQ